MKFSPFVYKLEFGDVVCLFHSLTLKKVYLEKKEFEELTSAIKNNKISQNLEKLKQLEFVVEDDYNKHSKIKEVTSRFAIEEPKPALSYIVLTDECNFRCKYCYVENAIQERKRYFMNEEQAKLVVEIIKNNSKNVKSYKVIFYGGEPLLNSKILKYIVENLEAINKNKFKFSIVTNGSLVNEEIANYFKEHNFNVGISLDGWRELNKDRVYKNGEETFFDVLKAIAILKKVGITPGISCTVTKHNFYLLPQIVDFFYQLGVKGIGFNLILDSTNKEFAVENPKLLAYYLFKAFERASELGIYEDRVGRRRAKPLFEEKPRFYDCPAYGGQIFFSPKSTLGPCQAFCTGDKYQEEMKKDFVVEKSEVMWEWIKIGGPLKNEKCWDCPAIGICGGSCAYDVYTKTGKLDFVDDYFCSFIKEILNYLLVYYYYNQIQKIKIMHLSWEHFGRLKKFIEELKAEKGLQMDLEKIKSIEGWAAYGMASIKQKNGSFVLAINQETKEVIGFSNLVKNKGKYEIGIAVRKDFRNKGVGTLLLNKILDDARRMNIKEVYALVKEANSHSIKFFKKNKFEQIAKEKSHLIFRKFL